MTRLAWMGSAVLLLGACGTKPEDTAAVGTSAGSNDCGGPAVDVTPGLEVLCDSGSCAFVIQATSPAPPDRGDNTWTLQVVDDTGAAVELSGLDVAPFMPAHNHGTVPSSYAGEKTDSDWVVGPFDLFMPGLWELHITAQTTAGAAETAVVSFCVEG